MSSVQSFPNNIEVTPSAAGLRSWINAHRHALAVSLVLIVVALGLRLLTFERYLPFLDYTDESVPFLIAQHWRGIDTNPFIRTRYAGYPPAFIVINIAVQQIVEATVNRPWTVPPDYFFALRLLAAFVGTVTVLVVASTAWQLAGWLAALLAGLVWAAAPIIVEHNSLATPDPYVYLTCATALSLGMYAWRRNSQIALTGSLVAGILAIYFKLWPVHAVFPFCIVALILLRRNGRRALPWLGMHVVIAAASALFLFQGIRPLDMPAREVITFNNDGVSFMLNPDRNFNNWYFAIYPIGMSVFVGGLVAGAVGYLYARRRGWRVVDWQHIALLAFYSFAGIMMASSFTNVWLGAGKIRHVLPVSVALIPIWGAAIQQAVWTVGKWTQEWQPGRNIRQFAAGGALALVGLFLLPVYVPGNIQVYQNFQRTAIHMLLWQWSDINLPTDGLILILPDSSLERTWNRAWSGYDGVKTFEWWHEDEKQIAASSPEAYVERGILYFVMNDQDRTGRLSTPAAQEFIAQLTPIKVFPAGPDRLGTTAYIYRMIPPQFEANATFGDQIILTGYDLNDTEAAPGEVLTFRPYWRTTRLPDTNYSMFIHLYPADEDRIITQHDGPLTVVDRPTLTWDDPEELYIGSDVALPLPADIQPGEYRLVVGVYDYTTGVRLTTDGGDSVTIPITVQP